MDVFWTVIGMFRLSNLRQFFSNLVQNNSSDVGYFVLFFLDHKKTVSYFPRIVPHRVRLKTAT